jgi:hypothetical protein
MGAGTARECRPASKRAFLNCWPGLLLERLRWCRRHSDESAGPGHQVFGAGSRVIVNSMCVNSIGWIVNRSFRCGPDRSTTPAGAFVTSRALMRPSRGAPSRKQVRQIYEAVETFSRRSDEAAGDCAGAKAKQSGQFPQRRGSLRRCRAALQVYP